MEQEIEYPWDTQEWEHRGRRFTWNKLWDADIEQPADVVEGFIPGSSLVMFAGDGGIGKSYVALEMALQVARGRPWLGMKTTQTPVLYLDCENRDWRQALRVEYISNGRSLDRGTEYPVTIEFEVDVTLDSDENAQVLRQMIEDDHAGLVILDSLVDFLDGLDENSNPEMAMVCKRLRGIIDETGATIVAIHHVSKGSAGKNWQTSRGASALKDNCDCSIQVIRSGNGTGDILTMRHDKAKDFAYKQVKARLNWDNYERLFNTTLFGAGDARDSTSGDSDEQAILDCLTPDQWRKRSDVIREAMETTKKQYTTMSETMRGLIERGRVEEDDGQFGRSTGVRMA
jgi:RecA-family ATPase